jgi:hypothetical protein
MTTRPNRYRSGTPAHAALTPPDVCSINPLEQRPSGTGWTQRNQSPGEISRRVQNIPGIRPTIPGRDGGFLPVLRGPDHV